MMTAPPFTRRQLLALAALGALPAGLAFSRPAPARRAAGGRPVRVVVELFTSQGCSACPPADALLGKLCRLPGVLGISYNVDIWDYLGWRDTLARPEFTRRHHLYARAWGQESVYTPQMVVNGRRCPLEEAPGRVARLLEEGGKEEGLVVPVRLRRRHKALLIDVGGAPPTLGERKATLWLVTMKRRHRQRIGEGENAGRDIVYHHVARTITPAGMWRGAPLRLELPNEHVMGEQADSCAVLLQLRGHGPIVGAAML